MVPRGGRSGPRAPPFGPPPVRSVRSASERPRCRCLQPMLQTLTLKLTLVASLRPHPMQFGLEWANDSIRQHWHSQETSQYDSIECPQDLWLSDMEEVNSHLIFTHAVGKCKHHGLLESSVHSHRLESHILLALMFGSNTIASARSLKATVKLAR